SVDTNDVAGLLPGLASAHTTAVLKGKTEDEVRTTIAGAAAGTTDDVAGEPAVEIHKPKLTIVTRIESLDDLTPELATKFQVVPSVGPAQRIFELPDVVVEARGALLGTQLREGGVGKFETQQSVETCRVTVADSKDIPELPNARSPAWAAAKRNMARANAEIVHKITTERSGPVANCVV